MADTQLPESANEKQRASAAMAEIASAAERARAVARLRTAADFGTADPRILDQSMRHSRIVGLLKIALPLLAFGLILSLAIYSMVFKPTNGVAISYSSRGDEETTIAMQNPRFVGDDAKHEPFEVGAQKARQNPDEPSLVEMTGVRARMEMQSKLGLNLVAARGVLDTANRILVLNGPLVVTSSDGYKITTTEARVDIQARQLTGQKPIVATGPWGSLTAAAFQADQKQRTVDFTGGIQIHFVPGAEPHP